MSRRGAVLKTSKPKGSFKRFAKKGVENFNVLESKIEPEFNSSQLGNAYVNRSLRVNENKPLMFTETFKGDNNDSDTYSVNRLDTCAFQKHHSVAVFKRRPNNRTKPRHSVDSNIKRLPFTVTSLATFDSSQCKPFLNLREKVCSFLTSIFTGILLALLFFLGYSIRICVMGSRAFLGFGRSFGPFSHAISKVARYLFSMLRLGFEIVSSYNRKGFSVHKVIRNNVYELDEICPVRFNDSTSSSLIDGTIFGLEFPFLIDTGAMLSLISDNVLSRLPKLKYKLEHRSGDVPLRAANGQDIKVIGQVFIPITIDKQNYPFQFSVAKNITYDVILGRDFLLHYEAHIDF